MSVTRLANSVDIAVSALQAQNLRMNVIASNIANVNTSRTETGEPYRKKDVVLSTDSSSISGVQISGIQSDLTTELKRMYQPGHPDADGDGYVEMPNVDLPVEMMHMMSASRAYQANTATMKRYQDSIDVTLELLR
jgi:flagellar basal-body rod protein FlgC